MLLAIDAGNTHIKLCLYDAGKLIGHWRLATVRNRTADEYAVQVRGLLALAGMDAREIDAVAVACVVLPLNQTLREMAERHFRAAPFFVDYKIEMGIEILYDAPQDVGADRLVNAAAAVHKYGAPCIVVDFGTATKFEAINEQRQYLGGVIAPGFGISMNALFEHAPRLPRVEIKRPPTVIGSSTVTALQSGLYHGYACLVDGMLTKMREELSKDARIVATGGLAHLIAGESSLIETIDDTLTLDGLRFIYERNQKNHAK